MSTRLLEAHPNELKFTFELKKQSSCSVRLSNKTSNDVAFKVKTTSPKKYCVRPNVGIVPANSSCEFTVTMQAQKVAPSDIVCKDKFLVQSTVVPAGTTEQTLNSSIFSKEAGAFVEEIKLRVSLNFNPSPIVSSGDKLLQQELSNEDVTCEDAIQSPFEQFQKLSGPEESKSISDQKSSEVNNTDPKLGKKTTRREWDRSNDVKISVMKLSPEKAMDEYEIDTSVKDVISTSEIAEHMANVSSPVKDKICYVEKSASKRSKEGSFSPVNGTSQNTSLVDHDPCKSPFIPNSETSNLVDSATCEDEITIPRSPILQINEKSKLIEEFKLAQEMMETKLNTLQSKVNQMELHISKLTEDQKMSAQDRSMLKEIEQLKWVRQKKVQPGFPLLFLVLVGMISSMLGYFSRC